MIFDTNKAIKLLFSALIVVDQKTNSVTSIDSRSCLIILIKSN